MLLYFYYSYTSPASKGKLSEICAFFYRYAAGHTGDESGTVPAWKRRTDSAENQSDQIFSGT